MSTQLLTNDYIRSYFGSFNEENARRRGAKSGEHCKIIYLNGLQEYDPFTNDDIFPLIESIKLADKYLIPFQNISKIPWKFMTFLEGEFPYPHTHGDTICIPKKWTILHYNKQNTKKLAETLVHEKIHIYQRKYPIYTHMLIMRVWNMKIQSFTEVFEKKEDVILRRNPDTNNFIYSDENGMIIVPEFKDNGSGIIDDRDHPFEIMAYKLCDYILGNKDPRNNEKIWMDKYL